jgi:UDP:flavonoid glycosyltransferase YjiC (YdhE family)
MAYAILGTVCGPTGLEPLAVIIDGLRRLDVDVVATVGPDFDPLAIDHDDPSVVVEQFAPQDLILARCSFAVIHGGSGSLLGALERGLPTVVVPLGADQFENAAAVERAGAGTVVPPNRLSVDSAVKASARCLSGDDLRRAATLVAAELTATPAATDVVPGIEQLVRES